MLVVSCNEVQPPIADKIEKTIQTCKGSFIDYYYWMRLSDEQKSATNPDSQTKKLFSFLDGENRYAKSILNNYSELTSTLYDEMKGRISDEDISIPYYDNGYYYYTKTVKGKNYLEFYRKKNNVEELILDVNAISEGHSFCNVLSMSVSPNNRFLSYCADFVGRNKFTLYIKDLQTGRLLQNEVQNVSYVAVWGADSETIYYVGKDMITLRADKIYRHNIYSEDQDELVYFEADPTFNIKLSASADKNFIFIECDNTLTDDVLYLKADDISGEFKSFAGREKGVKYTVDHNKENFYILTDRDGALNNKIMVCSDKDVSVSSWKTLIPCKQGILIKSFQLFDKYIAINQEKEANLYIDILKLDSGEIHSIEFDDPCFSAQFDVNCDTKSDVLRFNYTSLATPSTLFEYDMSSRINKKLKQTNVPTYVQADYSVERLWGRATDGTKIPISIIYKKGFEKNGKGKVFLYGYGSYGSSSNPRFDPYVISLLDRGFAYAIAHIRGGAEMGKEWYENGKLLNKKNTFTDFNDCAKYLISQGYTTEDNMYAYGASAGGLLMGAIVNMEPQLYKGIIAGVPFVDVINTMIDETIPLTTFEWDEWGDPRKEPYFSYMLSYSPYDNIKKQDYPNILVTSGFWDSQVQYWEPAKWVAKLREYKTDNNLLLFLCDMESGHGGASGRYNKAMKKAKEYTFILSL